MDYIKRILITLICTLSFSAHALICEPIVPDAFENRGYTEDSRFTVGGAVDGSPQAGALCVVSKSVISTHPTIPTQHIYRLKYGIFKEVICQAGKTTQATFFTGWGKTSVDAIGNLIPSTKTNAPSIYCSGACTHALDAANPVDDCTITQIPEGGFYEYQCTFNYKSLENPCSGSTSEQPSQKTAPPSP